MHVILSYKRDAESKDDQDLALLELSSLSAQEPQAVTHVQARTAMNAKALPFVHKSQKLYSVDVDAATLKKLLRRLAFWDFALFREGEAVPERVAVGRAWAHINGVLVAATQTQVLEWTAYAKDDRHLGDAIRNGHALEGLLKLGAPGIEAAVASPLTPISRRKNEYLTHGFHKYKAKFFPRLARSLINYTCPDDEGLVLDPYCGSGTTGLEASLMGMNAVEFDIDPLSVFIAQSKAILGHLDLGKFVEAVGRLPVKAPALSGDLVTQSRYKLPAFLTERNPRRLTAEIHKEIEDEATLIRSLIDDCKDSDVRTLFELSYSHALATKVALRWMGTGDNRFALEFAKRSLYSIFRAQLHFMLAKLTSWGELKQGGFLPVFGGVSVKVSDCTRLPLMDNSVNAVVTSPPYLPAASGRETYLRSRAASLVGLGLMTEEEVHETETRIVGSILAMPKEDRPLPLAVIDLVEWMKPQRERSPKARPTAAYFERLGDSLKEMKRVLKPGGLIALVVSKEHMFYAMTTREVLRKFDMVDAISELGTQPKYGIGLELDRVQLIELPKMDFNARPGSHGAYSEAILFFRKPAIVQ